MYTETAFQNRYLTKFYLQKQVVIHPRQFLQDPVYNKECV
jgi:hypothetical protein